MSESGSGHVVSRSNVDQRIEPSLVITLPAGPDRQDIPSVRAHAKRFAAALVLMVFAGAALLASPLTTESGTATPIVDALFTSFTASAVCGMIVVDTQDHWNFLGELVILVLVQVGGLGFMVGASIVLTIIGRGLSLHDSLMVQDGSPSLSMHEAIDLSRKIVRFMLVGEAIGVAILTPRLARDESWLNALWHSIYLSVTAFCNTGMDLEGGFRSLSGYVDSPWVNLPVMLMIQGGALSYITLHDVWSKRKWGPLTLDVKLVLITNAALLFGGGLAFLILEWGNVLENLDGGSKVLAAMFQSTTMRTAGFSTVSFTDAHPVTLFISIGIMMVGGAAGSTAGGIKLATLAILVLGVVTTVRGHEEPGAFGRRIAMPLVYRAMTVTALFLLAHFVFTLALAITENVIAGKEFGFLPLMFETMSGLASVGLSTGITPDLSAAGKIILCVCIYLGRLGPIMAVYALQTAHQPTRYRLPEAPVRIG